ncbi:MAG: GIY-YIG nuclease family protein [Nitrospira sp.]|nr:GIY-YIG nuclease family protein [Candidatus Manganitrophaceae bacterium]
MATATLKIFLAFGDPKRLRTAELSNWTGKAVAGPRSEFEKVLKREESLSPGVYFLTGIDPDTNKSAIYIGEAESIGDRIKSHLSKDFWNNVAFFISKDENLTKAHIRYIEGRLIEIAKSADRSVVMNSQGSGAKLPESDREDMEIFLEKMQQVLPVLGIEAFVQAASKVESEAEKEMLTCKIKNVVASGYLTPNGIVVLATSEAVLEERGSAKKWPSVMAQRNKLIEEGGLVKEGDKHVFVKDTEFSSPSSAAAVIHGGSANGLIAWVNANGKSLKDLQNV